MTSTTEQIAADDMDPVAELLAAVESVADQISADDVDRLRYWAKRVAELNAN